MNEVALITDTHFGVKNDSPEFIEVQKDFYENQFFPTLVSRGIKNIIHLGDIFDRRKYTNHQTLQVFKECFFDQLVKLNIKMYLILGNHDVYYKSTNTVNSPELFLSQYEDNIEIVNEPTVVKIKGYEVAMMPWINNQNYDLSISMMEDWCSDGIDLMCGHFEIRGFEMHRNGGVNTGGLKAEVFNGFRTVLSGHFHEPSTKGNISYLGAPYEYTWADFNCDRGFYIMDLLTHEREYFKNSNKMFYRITYDEFFDVEEFDVEQLEGKIVRIITADKMDIDLFEQFVEKVQNANPYNFEIIDNIGYHIDEDAVDKEALESEDTLAIVKSYVDECDIALDKDKINKMFKSLYFEAIDLT